MSSNPIINANIELVSVLCGPNAVTFNGILAALNSQYPSTGWTSEMLTSYLTAGQKKGLIIAVGSSPAGPVEGYQLNKKALSLNNPQNNLYAPFCSQFVPLNCSCGGFGSATGTGSSGGGST